MSILKSLVDHLNKVHPDANIQIHPGADVKIGVTYSSNIEATITSIPLEYATEVVAFFAGVNTGREEGYKMGKFEGMKHAELEYSKAIADIIDQAFEDGRLKGYDEGYKEGVSDEIEESILPSDAYDIEVFSVQPSNDHPSGKQAFIGYKFDLEGEPQFHYIQVGYAAIEAPKKQIKVYAKNDQQINTQSKVCSCNTRF